MASAHALLLISTSCPHCASVLQSLSEMIKAGVIAKLEVVNLSETPQLAQQYSVRSVPYVRIGLYELEGLHTTSELTYWAEHVGSGDAMAKYFDQALRQGGLQKVLNILKQEHGQFFALISLMRDPATELPVRIGIGAIMEEYEGSEELQNQVENIATLIEHADARTRLDACHFLALSHSQKARPYIELLLNDEDADVRAEAKESLEMLQSH